MDDAMLMSRRLFSAMMGGVGQSRHRPIAHTIKPSAEEAILKLPLFTDIASSDVPSNILAIETSGYSRIGSGAGFYVETQTSAPARFRARTANARWFELQSADVHVEMFGAIGNLAAVDDTDAIEAAIAYIHGRGGGLLRCDGQKTYHLSRMIEIDPVRVSLDAQGATWQFNMSPSDLGAAALRPCLLVRVGPGSPQYGHTRRFCRGLRLAGPAGAPHDFDGMVFDTLVPALSSRWAIYSCEAAVNFRRGLVLGNRAYLLQAYSSSFSGSVACVATLPGSEDAGESIDFFGCSFGNGGIGIKNTGGMELKLFGGSIDDCRQFFSGGGQVTLFGTHLEMSAPKTFDQYPVEMTSGGDFTMKGGTLLVTPDGANDFMFYGKSALSRVRLEHVDGYGWPAASGQLMGGAGRLLIDGIWWGQNHQIVPVVKRDAMHNLFGAGGSFDGPHIAIGCAVSSPAGENRGPHLCLYAGGGREFTAGLAISNRQARSGSASLGFQKKGWSTGTGTPVVIFAPAGRRRMISTEFWYHYSGLSGGGSGGTFWIDLAFAQVLGFDQNRVPLIGQSAVCQEIAVAAEPARQGQWRRALLSSTYAGQTSPTDGTGPDWTTHLLLSINPVQMPDGFELHIDDLYGFVF